jgi:hypothetical protein
VEDNAGQLAARHSVPAGCLAQPPVALQTPVLPHVEAAMAGHPGSAVPALTGVQVPRDPAIAHDWQVPQSAAPQQTPSVQCPLMH